MTWAGFAGFSGLFGIIPDPSGNLYIPFRADAPVRLGGRPHPPNGTVEEVSPVGTNRVVTTIAGSSGSGSADGLGTNALFGSPIGITRDSQGNLYISDSYFHEIRKLSALDMSWNVTTLAGSAGNAGSGDGVGTNAQFNSPQGLATDSAGNVYVADSLNNTIREVTSTGVVTTLAGAPSGGGSANGVGGAARFNSPNYLATDKAGNIYVADLGNQTIRKITPLGEVFTVAGSPGQSGSADGIAGEALFFGPSGVTVDSSNNIYVADTFNSTIRKITSTGVVTTIAGQPGTNGTLNGLGTNTLFNNPTGIAADARGNLYVTDTDSSLIRRLSPSGASWLVTTLAGGGSQVDGIGTNSQFNFPLGIAVDSASNLYVIDSGFATIRELTPVVSPGLTNWVVSTIAGGASGPTTDLDGVGTNAFFLSPLGIAVDRETNLYVTDIGNNIRQLNLVGTNWNVTTIGGNGIAGSADGTGSAAQFSGPSGVAVDAAGNVYVADTGNNTIRKGTFTQYGTANPAAYTPPAMTGKVQVTLLPAEASGQWRFPWELVWHNSGFTATNLAPGNYPMEFRNLPGWLAIPPGITLSNPVVVLANTTTQITNNYYPTLVPSGVNSLAGSLSINLGANPPAGAGWRFLGDATPFFASNFTTNLLPGTYLIEFAGPFNNRVTPPNASVQVFAGQPTFISVSYPFAAAPPANVLLPTPVVAGNISDLTDYPFGFNGQLQTDVGFGSGVVVQSNVVLTAAHLLFNDDTQAYVSAAYWFPQQNIPAYVPTPLIARGEYLLTGYAMQRTNDLSSGIYGPDVSSPQSRNVDVAALYFSGPIASGGYGGYLPSDALPNQWLTSTAEKMLVGYPVDGSLFGFTNIVPGQMYQIGPQPYPLSLSPDAVTNQQEVYTASWFLSYPGNSGGPLYVQLNNYFYPAGVYLGTLNGQSVVRGIDSNVVNLITLAATLGDNGTNFNGGGVIQLVSNQAISANNQGYLQIQIQPASAVQDGGGWRLLGDATYASTSNYTRVVTSTNIGVQFNPIPGWILPTNQTITVAAGSITTNVAFYTVLPPTLVAKSTAALVASLAQPILPTASRPRPRLKIRCGSALPPTPFLTPASISSSSHPPTPPHSIAPSGSITAKSLSENYTGCCGEGFWLWPRRAECLAQPGSGL